MIGMPNWLNKFRKVISGGGGGGTIPSGYEAWWKFEEGSGTTAADSSGNSHTATLNGGTGWAAGQIGSHAIAYAGDGAGLSFTAITTSDTFTYAAWIYCTANSGYRNLFAHGASQGLWLLNGKIDWVYSGADHLSNTAIALNAWHHIAVVSSAGSVTFYLDGVADGTASTAVSFDANGMGADGGNSGEGFAGDHDSVLLYLRALSSSEITQIYSYR